MTKVLSLLLPVCGEINGLEDISNYFVLTFSNIKGTRCTQSTSINLYSKEWTIRPKYIEFNFLDHYQVALSLKFCEKFHQKPSPTSLSLIYIQSHIIGFFRSIRSIS